MDAVKIVHSMYFVQRTKGLQVSWPVNQIIYHSIIFLPISFVFCCLSTVFLQECVNFYATANIAHSTHGVLVCRQNKKATEQVLDKLLLERLGIVDAHGEMIELSFIVPGRVP